MNDMTHEHATFRSMIDGKQEDWDIIAREQKEFAPQNGKRIRMSPSGKVNVVLSCPPAYCLICKPLASTRRTTQMFSSSTKLSFTI